MKNDIIKVLNRFPEIKLITGPKLRKDKDTKNESGDVVTKGNVYYDCLLECKAKRFHVTFIPAVDIKKKLFICLEQNGIKL